MGGSEPTYAAGGYQSGFQDDNKPYVEPSAQPYLVQDNMGAGQYEPLDPSRMPEDNKKFHFGGCRDFFFVILFLAGLVKKKLL
jgi:hypothetical protein